MPAAPGCRPGQHPPTYLQPFPVLHIHSSHDCHPRPTHHVHPAGLGFVEGGWPALGHVYPVWSPCCLPKALGCAPRSIGLRTTSSRASPAFSRNPRKHGPETQGSTAELITGLVPQSYMTEIAQEEALLVLCQLDSIDFWNPDAPVKHFGILVHRCFIHLQEISHQMLSSTKILKWLQEILICRNKFLLKNKYLKWQHTDE
ncbi:uncharacterized protein LOC129057624 [Pongo abelii]|uniref:uncharacterized protein LOC129057624 n=1 Tax=Pongo abelii TaxID=9601 RepID=UPI0023E756CC|nr:uncharacterized protein LOC129057624 isoform X1 [Pongo abelii]XP_054403776.1 uncharacterized protein LOC129057624 isoform X1 [Pongo abelii]